MVDIQRACKYSDKWFLELYLRHGSVEEVIRSYPDNLPISAANYHRLVKKYGLIKSAGRHVGFAETLHFFKQKAFRPGTPLEQIYKTMPLSFQTSLSTLHRIYQYVEKQAVRRYGAALIISTNESSDVLVGNEVFSRSRYGKRVGDISIPMGFAKRDETNFESTLRVLQQEVFSDAASSGRLSGGSPLAIKLLKRDIEPISYFDIVDVRVKVFKVSLPRKNIENFSSFKLTNLRFENIYDLNLQDNVRSGVSEILSIYESEERELKPKISRFIASINTAILL